MKRMKQWLFGIGTLMSVVAVGILYMPVKAAGNVAVNEKNFPDPVLRDYISSHYDKDYDRSLNDTEISKATSIWLTGGSIEKSPLSNLKGIELLPNLESLVISNSLVKSVDISHNPKLTLFRCDGCPIMEIDVSKNTNLKSLNCEDCKLTKLTIGKKEFLKEIRCSNNRLTTLDVSSLPNLEDLFCEENQIAKLNVKNCVNLSTLYCYGNKLQSLDVSNNKWLYELECSGNEITTLKLHLSEDSTLRYLICSENKISSLDVSVCPELELLICEKNQLTALDVSKNPKLNILVAGYNRLTKLNVSANPELDAFCCQNNQLTKLDLSKNLKLYTLLCSGNKLTQLDLSKNTEMNQLGCMYNNISSLDVSKMPHLLYLSCAGNQIGSLDVSNNLGLSVLNCSANPIKKLDISNQYYLTKAYKTGGAVPEEFLEYNYETIDKKTMNAKYLEDQTVIMGASCIIYDKGLDISYLGKPVKLSLSAASGGVKISWDAYNHAEKYAVYKIDADGKKQKIGTTRGLTYKDSSATPGDPNLYSAVAVSDAGYEMTKIGKGTPISFTGDPVALKLTSKAAGVLVSWDKVENAAKYQIYRKKEGGSWEKLATTTSLQYSDKKAVYSETYRYSVRALTAKGNYINKYGNGKKITYLVTGPKLTLTNYEDGIEISWKPMTNAVKYRVYLYNGSTGLWERIAIVKGTSYTDQFKNAGISRTYAVVGLDSGDRAMNVYGAGTSITRSNAFVGLEVASTIDGVQLSWSKYVPAASYRVYRKNDAGKWVKLATVSGCNFTDAEAVVKAENIYSVIAVASDGTALTGHGRGMTVKFVIPTTPVVGTVKSSGIRLDWESVCQAAGYKVYRKTKSTDWAAIGSTSGLSYSDKSVESGKTYYYTVVALDGNGKALNAKGEGVQIKFTASSGTKTSAKNAFSDEELQGSGIAEEEILEIPVEEITEEDIEEEDTEEEDIAEEDVTGDDEDITDEDATGEISGDDEDITDEDVTGEISGDDGDITDEDVTGEISGEDEDVTDEDVTGETSGEDEDVTEADVTGTDVTGEISGDDGDSAEGDIEQEDIAEEEIL